MGILAFLFLTIILVYIYGFLSILQITAERVWTQALCQAPGVGFEWGPLPASGSALGGLRTTASPSPGNLFCFWPPAHLLAPCSLASHLPSSCTHFLTMPFSPHLFTSAPTHSPTGLCASHWNRDLLVLSTVTAYSRCLINVNYKDGSGTSTDVTGKETWLLVGLPGASR